MINASLAMRKSNDWFEKKYESEIKYIEDKIWEVVYEGLRSVWIYKDEGAWVGEFDFITQRLITHFREIGFEVKIIKEGLGYMSKWSDDCSGIKISWG